MGESSKRYVLDTSVIVKWFVTEEDSDKAESFLNDLIDEKIEVVIPISLFYELANVLWVRRLQGLSQAGALSILKDFRRLNLEVVSSPKLVEEAQAFAYRYNISIYDAVFMALSESRACEFITADEKLYRKVSLSWVKLLKSI